jgi:hypothetical protein
MTTTTKNTLVDWLDDLCVRFIVNLPNEELQSVERICFQIEEAQWFYEDFIRPLDPNNLPSMHLRRFSQLMFQHCPLFSAYSEELHTQAYEQFLAYKTRVPVRGAIMLNQDMTHAVLVKGWRQDQQGGVGPRLRRARGVGGDGLRPARGQPGAAGEGHEGPHHHDARTEHDAVRLPRGAHGHVL